MNFLFTFKYRLIVSKETFSEYIRIYFTKKKKKENPVLFKTNLQGYNHLLFFLLLITLHCLSLCVFSFRFYLFLLLIITHMFPCMQAVCVNFIEYASKICIVWSRLWSLFTFTDSFNLINEETVAQRWSNLSNTIQDKERLNCDSTLTINPSVSE